MSQYYWHAHVYSHTHLKVSSYDVNCVMVSSCVCLFILETPIKIMVFWLMNLCTSIDGYQYFRGMCCLHLQRREDQITRFAGYMTPAMKPSFVHLPFMI